MQYFLSNRAMFDDADAHGGLFLISTEMCPFAAFEDFGVSMDTLDKMRETFPDNKNIEYLCRLRERIPTCRLQETYVYVFCDCLYRKLCTLRFDGIKDIMSYASISEWIYNINPAWNVSVGFSLDDLWSKPEKLTLECISTLMYLSYCGNREKYMEFVERNLKSILTYLKQWTRSHRVFIDSEKNAIHIEYILRLHNIKTGNEQSVSRLKLLCKALPIFDLYCADALKPTVDLLAAYPVPDDAHKEMSIRNIVIMFHQNLTSLWNKTIMSNYEFDTVTEWLNYWFDVREHICLLADKCCACIYKLLSGKTLTVLPVVAVIAILYNSPFAFFLPPLESGDTVTTVASAYVSEFNRDINTLANEHTGYDTGQIVYVDFEGESAGNFNDIVTIYMVKYGVGDTATVIHINPKMKWIHNLDKLPFPAADLLEMKRYNHVTIITSRGCPNNCSFCTVHPTVGRVHRARSVENVIAEIKYYIKKFGIKVFNIEDDNFAFDFNRANDILDCLIKLDEDLTLNLPNGMTAINIDENMIKKYGKLKMKDSFIGLETTSEERLKKISKTFTSLDKVQHITELFNKYGMDIGASLVVGFPEQTIDQMIDDIVKLMQHNIKFGTANPCYPIPKSRLYEECLEQGFVDEKMDYTWYDEFNFPLETDLFTRKDIYELWNCSLVYAIYPAMLEVMKNGFNSMNNLLEAFSRFGYGEMYKSEFDSEVYYCVPLYKNTFSCMMKLSEQNDNENVFVDDWTCDILSNLCTLYTGINYEVYQAESALVPNGRNAFIIKQSGKISNIKTKLIGAIHKCEDK